MNWFETEAEGRHPVWCCHFVGFRGGQRREQTCCRSSIVWDRSWREALCVDDAILWFLEVERQEAGHELELVPFEESEKRRRYQLLHLGFERAAWARPRRLWKLVYIYVPDIRNIYAVWIHLRERREKRGHDYNIHPFEKKVQELLHIQRFWGSPTSHSLKEEKRHG